MNSFSPHLFVDISCHGLGHLAQAAPVLNELTRLLPRLRLTVRSGLPVEKLRASVRAEFTHIARCSDFGYVMLDAVRIDVAASAAAYSEHHAHWAQRVVDETGQLVRLQPDLVLSDVSYLPLAGAAQAGIRSLSMCSLNWADLFAHFFGGEAWAAPIHNEILGAYNSAECFLRLTPGMPMSELSRVKAIAPVAALGRDCRIPLREKLACRSDEKVVLIAFGGIDKQVPVEQWQRSPGVRWLVPQRWGVDQGNVSSIEVLGLAFPDLLRSVDAVLTKPGYGTFTEAACNGAPVLYLRRDDWPEQNFLIDWLKINARCCEISEAALKSGFLREALDKVWQQVAPAVPRPTGAAEAAAVILTLLEPAKT